MQRRKRRAVRASLVIALGLMMFVPVMMAVPESAQAVTYYYETDFPSAKNSTFWQQYPRYTTGHTAAYGAQVFGDGNTKEIYGSALHSYLQTNDFTGEPELGSLPPITATITYVWVLMIGTNAPETTLSLSISGEGVSATSGVYAPVTYGFILEWNVSAEAAWTPELVGHQNLTILATMHAGDWVHHYIDYLGLVIYWTDTIEDPEAIPDEDHTPPSGDTLWTYDLTGGGVVGIMGVVGLGGLIATPAWAVLSFRNSDDGRIVTFIKALAMGTFCLTLFLASFLA